MKRILEFIRSLLNKVADTATCDEISRRGGATIAIVKQYIENQKHV